MPKIENQKIKTRGKKIVEVMPIATRFNGGKVEVHYYTKEGEKVPKECIKKEIVKIPSFFEVV